MVILCAPIEAKIIPIIASPKKLARSVPTIIATISIMRILSPNCILISLLEKPIAFLIAMVAFVGFFIFFRYTNIGLAMRATSEDQQLAESVGLRVRVILAVTWGIAAVLAGIAGILQAGSSANSSIDTNIQFMALRAFPAVLLGGLESIGGALVGGIILGLTESWAQMLFNTDVATNLAPYLVLMIVLVIRPEGLFGEKRIDRI